MTTPSPATAKAGGHVSRGFFNANAPILHLAAIRLESDRAGRGHLKRVGQQLAVARATRHTVFHDDLDFVPVLRPVFLQLLVGTGDEIVATLELRPAHVDAAVR